MKIYMVQIPLISGVLCSNLIVKKRGWDRLERVLFVGSWVALDKIILI